MKRTHRVSRLRRPTAAAWRAWLSPVFALALFVPAAAAPVGPPAGGDPLEGAAILVAFHPKASNVARAGTVSRLGLTVAGARSPHFVRLRIPDAALASGRSVASTIEALRRDPAVRVAEPDSIVQGASTPNDPGFPLLWGLHNTGQDGGVADADIDAPEAWERPLSASGVVVAVLDTGADYSHPDLAQSILRDGAGRVVGYDFYNEDGDPMDDHGHGTHVSGTIAARGNNGIGVVGVCPTAKIMPLKWLRYDNRGRTSDEIRAIDFAREAGARVINISAGSYQRSQLTLEALQRARDAGILVVAAAMNDASDNDQAPVYPAGHNRECENVVAVAASDRFDNLASFSNYGAESVDLAAPGAAILSTVPNNRYEAWDGTSMASPHVAGAAALLLSADASLTLGQLKARLLACVDYPDGLAGRVRTGRLNLARAFGDAWEPDDDPGEASDVQAGAAGQHTFHLPGDVDRVRFTVPAGARVVAVTSGLAGDTDTVLGLLAPDGTTVLATDDDGGGGRASRIEYTCASGGTYFVAAIEYGARGGAGFGYTLTVGWTAEPPAPPDQWEPDDSAAQAPLLRAKQVTSHTFHVAGDVDWVKVVAKKGRRSFATSGLTGGADTVIELFAPDGTLVGSDDDSGGGGASLLTVRLRRSGTFYLRVRDYNGAGGAGLSYQLTAR